MLQHKIQTLSVENTFLESQRQMFQFLLSARGIQRDRLESSFLNHSVSKFIVRILIHIMIQGLGI